MLYFTSFIFTFKSIEAKLFESFHNKKVFISAADVFILTPLNAGDEATNEIGHVIDSDIVYW